jgi:hypothetical protein
MDVAVFEIAAFRIVIFGIATASQLVEAVFSNLAWVPNVPNMSSNTNAWKHLEQSGVESVVTICNLNLTEV